MQATRHDLLGPPEKMWFLWAQIFGWRNDMNFFDFVCYCEFHWPMFYDFFYREYRVHTTFDWTRREKCYMFDQNTHYSLTDIFSRWTRTARRDWYWTYGVWSWLLALLAGCVLTIVACSSTGRWWRCKSNRLHRDGAKSFATVAACWIQNDEKFARDVHATMFVSDESLSSTENRCIHRRENKDDLSKSFPCISNSSSNNDLINLSPCGGDHRTNGSSAEEF